MGVARLDPDDRLDQTLLATYSPAARTVSMPMNSLVGLEGNGWTRPVVCRGGNERSFVDAEEGSSQLNLGLDVRLGALLHAGRSRLVDDRSRVLVVQHGGFLARMGSDNVR